MSNIEIIWPEEASNNTGASSSFVQIPEPGVSENNPSGLDLGWDGMAAVVVGAALLLKVIHGPAQK